MSIGFGTTAQRLARWERIRSKGSVHFVLLWGVLSCVAFGTVVEELGVRFLGMIRTPPLFAWSNPVFVFLDRAIPWMSIGVFVGLLSWTLNEREYQASRPGPIETRVLKI